MRSFHALQLPGWTPPKSATGSPFSSSATGASGIAAAVAGAAEEATDGSGGQAGLTTSCGTPSYVAPEILRGERYGEKVSSVSHGSPGLLLLRYVRQNKEPHLTALPFCHLPFIRRWTCGRWALSPTSCCAATRPLPAPAAIRCVSLCTVD